MSGTKDIADNFEVGEVWTTDYKRKRSEENPESYEAYREYVKALDKLEKNGATIRTPTASNDPIVKDGKLEIRALVHLHQFRGIMKIFMKNHLSFKLMSEKLQHYLRETQPITEWIESANTIASKKRHFCMLLIMDLMKVRIKMQ